jgi:hypothetical protein
VFEVTIRVMGGLVSSPHSALHSPADGSLGTSSQPIYTRLLQSTALPCRGTQTSYST